MCGFKHLLLYFKKERFIETSLRRTDFKHIMPEIVINADGIAKSFGSQRILNNVSLRISEGERYGLVGLNGAGKTTLIRLLLGVLKPTSGSISVLGIDPWSHDAALFRRMGIVLEHDGFWGNLTFEQNMTIFAKAKGISRKDLSVYIEEHWKYSLLYNNKKPVKHLSRGQRMQCALARAFLGRPRLFLFDEPAVALDVDAYEHFRNLVKSSGQKGAAFLISSHQLDAIDDLCDRVGILRDGRVTEMDTPEANGGKTRWALEADENPECASIIAEVCGNVPSRHDGVWEFPVRDRKTTIPRLIKRLVEAGCEIQKIAPISDTFSDTIREHYRNKNTADPTNVIHGAGDP
jgi:ABC-type multidrug transport system ATPase subunit